MGTLIDQTLATTHCTHCGDLCREDQTEENGRVFCCAGCATVYTILKENNLLDFYGMGEEAGRKKVDDGRDYAWLDVPKLAERVLRYRDAERCHIDLELPAIHCASCVWLLERLPQLLPGVRACSVDFSRRNAAIVFDPRQVTLRQVAEQLDRIGYPPHLRTQAEATQQPENRALIYRIGVAGFCFGNIMLLSFPEYFGLSEVLPSAMGSDAGAEWMAAAMGYLMLGLSLPVLLYAGRGFFTAAWYAVNARRMTIDVPIAIGMVALFGRSVYELVSGSGPGYLDSLAGLVFFLLIGRWFQSYTFARLNFDRNYHDYFPIAAYRENAVGDLEAVASEDVVAGDVLLVRPGQLIPADGYLSGQVPAAIDYSFVTGEAVPQAVAPNAEVFAGGRATDTALRIVVSKPAEQSYLLQLWLREGKRQELGEVAPPEGLIRVFTIFLLLLSAATLVYWYSRDVATAYRAATAVLIIACPCALALAAPFAYGTLQRLLAARGYYFRGPAVIRELANTDTYVFDKTGTLTGEGLTEQLHFHQERVAFFDGVFLAMARQSDHPKSRAIRTALEASLGNFPELFTAGVTETVGQGLYLQHEGREFRIGTPGFCGLESLEGGTCATVDGELYFQMVAAAVNLRPGVGEMLRQLGERGATWLLSGDQAPVRNTWSAYLAEGQILFQQSPFDKRSRINDLQAGPHRVLMVGDGLNDAGALAAASVGLAVNDDAARFNPACDGIVQGAQLPLLPEVLAAATRLRWVLALTFVLAFCYNAVGLYYAVTGTLSPVVAAILMPLSSVTIMVVATVGAWLVDLGIRQPSGVPGVTAK